MFKINLYLFNSTTKYLILNLFIILFLIIFLNLIELSRVLNSENQNIYHYLILTFYKIPTSINETSPFVVIVAISFLFRYLINNNEFISMRNIGFSIFDIFKPIAIAIFCYSAVILFIINPISAFFEIKYDKMTKKENTNMYSIKISENSMWVKNKSNDKSLKYINIENIDLKKMKAKKINILSIGENNKFFLNAERGFFDNNKFILNNVNIFDTITGKYNKLQNLELKLNFSKENIMNSILNYKNIPYYNYPIHIKTLQKFNLYTSEIGLFYLSEFLKPFFMIVLGFVVMGFSAKFRRNENFFKILFIAILIGFLFFFFKEIITKLTISLNVNFIISYVCILLIPFLVGLYKVVQIEND